MEQNEEKDRKINSRKKDQHLPYGVDAEFMALLNDVIMESNFSTGQAHVVLRANNKVFKRFVDR